MLAAAKKLNDLEIIKEVRCLKRYNIFIYIADLHFYDLRVESTFENFD